MKSLPIIIVVNPVHAPAALMVRLVSNLMVCLGLNSMVHLGLNFYSTV